jgi:hypothetical protein
MPDSDDTSEFDRRDSSSWGRRSYDRVSLQYYFETVIHEIDRRLGRIDGALDRFADQRDHYVQRPYYDEHHDGLVNRINELERWQSNIKGRAVTVGVVGAAFVAALASLITRLVVGG